MSYLFAAAPVLALTGAAVTAVAAGSLLLLLFGLGLLPSAPARSDPGRLDHRPLTGVCQGQQGGPSVQRGVRQGQQGVGPVERDGLSVQPDDRPARHGGSRPVERGGRLGRRGGAEARAQFSMARMASRPVRANTRASVVFGWRTTNRRPSPAASLCARTIAATPDESQ